MTKLVPELAGLPPGPVLDGEVVAWSDDRLPSFPHLCERMLHGKTGIPVTYMIFDLLEESGRSWMHRPYWQRRRRLDKLGLSGPHWQTSEAFDDGEALFESVRLAKLEGVVAKKLSQPYRPGERLWVKVKNRDYWRFPLEREGRFRAARRKIIA
jgi:bifunctional non-homologous end joining protein LigD